MVREAIIRGVEAAYQLLEDDYAFETVLHKIESVDTNYASREVNYSLLAYPCRAMLPPARKDFSDLINQVTTVKAVVFDFAAPISFRSFDRLVVRNTTYEVVTSTELVQGSHFELRLREANARVDLVGATAEVDDVIASESIPPYSVVAINSEGGIVLASSGEDTAYSILGISLLGALPGGRVSWCIMGNVTNPSWNFTAGELLFLGENGQMTHTVPTEGASVNLGQAISSTSILFRVGKEVEITNG